MVPRHRFVAVTPYQERDSENKVLKTGVGRTEGRRRTSAERVLRARRARAECAAEED